MKIIEVFKAESEAERRKAVTELMIKLEDKKRKDAEVTNQPKAG